MKRKNLITIMIDFKKAWKRRQKRIKKYDLSASETKYSSYLFGAPYEVCGYPKRKEVQ